MRRVFFFIALTISGFLPLSAQAHKPSDSYLTLNASGDGLSGQWDIALRDLDYAIGLDADGNGAITWGELKVRHGEIGAYALARLRIGPKDAPCVMMPNDHMVAQHSDGAYATLLFEADCATAADSLEVAYQLFFDLNPQHRGLVLAVRGEEVQSAVLSPDEPGQIFDLAEPNVLAQIMDYFREGVWHIWIGYDHILFLLTLLLPAVFVWVGGAWRPVDGFGAAFFSVAKIVTAFTVAHSVTLSLAALGVVSLPVRLVESAIAVSVIVAALNNVWPLVTRRLWLVAFAFGLVHGFGFASVLADLGLPGSTLIAALAGFNVGVEAGQLAIVALVLPATYWLRRTTLYGGLAVPMGSFCIAAIGLWWLLERAFGLNLPLV